MCTPATSSPTWRAREIAWTAASGESPNFDSSCAVRIAWCVTASTPGVSRTSTRRTPAAAARSASSGASITTVASASAAASSSSADLLLPWKRSRSPGIPAARANASSPSVETSAPTPSSASSRSSATFANAFVP